MGLPGTGKTTLASAISAGFDAVHFNADRVRDELYRGELGFSIEDRIEHARRMGWLCDRVVEADQMAVADFVCPTPETRAAFGEAFVVWMDRPCEDRFPDTTTLFVPPTRYDLRITDGTVDESLLKFSLAWSVSSVG